MSKFHALLGKFLVDSLYKALIQPDVPVDNNSKIWKTEIHLKTKMFAWYLHRGIILIKDNLEIGSSSFR
jgi:hypothetical protein